MSDFVINDEQPMRGTLIDAIRIIREYINRPIPPENTLIGAKTGTIITADDAFPNIPKGAKVFGKSTQDGTPTPDAPVPILSVDDLTLNLCGKNLLGFDDVTLSNVTYTELTNGFTVTATRDSGWSYIRVQLPLPIMGTTYILSFNATAGYRVTVEQYNSEGTRITYAIATTNTLVITARDSVVRFDVLFYARDTSAGTVGDTCTYTNVQLEIGSTATEYAPYVGTTIPVSLDNHILRSLPDGTCDELTFTYIEPSEREGWGVFDITLVQRITYDIFTACISMSSNYRGVLAPNGTAVGPASPAAFANAYSNIGIISINLINLDNYGVAIQSNGSILCKVQDKTTVNELNAWLADNPVSIEYQLPTPVTHDLGTIELPMYPAPNFTFFANGGNAQPDVQISYERDITIVIDKLEAAETPVGSLSISPVINHTIESAVETAILQEETEWQSDSI